MLKRIGVKIQPRELLDAGHSANPSQQSMEIQADDIACQFGCHLDEQEQGPSSDPDGNEGGKRGPGSLTNGTDVHDGHLKNSSSHQIVNNNNNNTISYNVSDGEEEHYECYGEVSDEDDEAHLIHNPNRLADDSRPSRAGKKNALSAQASQLAKDSNHINSHSRQSSSCESGDDMFSGDLALEEDVLDLNEKIQYLQQQLNVLAEGQHSSDDKYSKVKQENSNLTSRLLSLEEQLKEIELKSEERLREEQKRTKEMMSKLEREKNLQIENYTINHVETVSIHGLSGTFFLFSKLLMNLEKEHYDLRDEVTRLRSLCERLKEEKVFLQEQLSEKESEVVRLNDDVRKLQELSRREREDFSKERNSNTLLLNDLTKELEDLRNYRDESEAVARARSPSFFEYPSKVRELEADQKVIKQQNQTLQELNEELQAQILNNNFQQGFQLLASQPTADSSLADEFDACSKDEIRKALKDQQDENIKLRMYIDSMLLNIIDHSPALLEVNKGL
ncbi:Rab11 family-interacting protein 4A [Nymphon striatum]|nr:Rab11 family-interacting protein 4A [Nymphon striatum]